MANPLNLYATKVFAEHPTSLWSLDEKVGYLSLWNSPGDATDYQNFSNWTVSGATPIAAELMTELPPNPPFEVTNNTFVENDQNGGLVIFRNSKEISAEDINIELGSFAISFYLYSLDRSVQTRIGYTYTDTQDGEIYEVIRPVNIPVLTRGGWAFTSATFDLPENFSNLSPFFEIKYDTSEIQYEFAINGISFGQWSEEFHTSSLGNTPESLPTGLPISGFGVKAQPYGLQGSSGYYIVNNNSLCAKNTGMPLVYGSDNSTRIIPNENGPSLILPGGGFLNQSGKFTALTLEFWTKINTNAVTDRRIFGPLSSDDGLYVDRHLLKLKIGNKVGSFPVGEWERPMLLSIRLNSTKSSLLINGEEVISMELSSEDVNYPAPENDWLGFFAYDDVPSIQVESAAVYPYEVPKIVQKRRFVYGQGVDFPSSIGGLSHTSIAAIDYSVANYAKNVMYPQTYSWTAGSGNNIKATGSSISLPEYPLPKLYLTGDESNWYSDNYLIFDQESPSFSLRPSAEYSDNQGFLYFNNLSFFNENPASVYGVFESESLSGKQTLLRFVDETNASALDVSLNENTIEYSVEYLDSSSVAQKEIFYSCGNVQAGDRFAVGINFTAAARKFGQRVASFMGNIQSSRMYIGGRKDYTNTFGGKIHRVSFSNFSNIDKLSNIFADNGLCKDYENGSLFENSNKLSQSGTYTLVGRSVLSRFGLDIATSSYWEDYAPLSYFGRYVTDQANEKFFALDFLQFNIDYVRLRNFVDEKYDTSSMPVKTYISFQYLKNGANNSIAYFSNTNTLPKNGVVVPGNEWLTTKYEVLDNTILRPPIGVNVADIALVIHIEINSGGILNDNIRIKTLEIASQALGKQANEISTMFGAKIIPYRRSGLFFEYKNVSPFSISKETSPYLHLTKNGGIQSRVDETYSGFGGLSIPINTTASEFFKVDLFQMSLKYEEELFPTEPMQIFEIQAASDYIRFYLVADSNTKKRGQVYAIDANTGTLRSDIVYYIDGNVVKRPILNPTTWSTLSFSFLATLDFSNTPGALRVTSPILFDNLSYYQITQTDDVQRFAFRNWASVRNGQDLTYDWSNWESVTWNEVLYLSETNAELTNAQRVYKTFTGTNSFILDSDSTLVINNYRSSVYKDLSWTSSIITPV